MSRSRNSCKSAPHGFGRIRVVEFQPMPVPMANRGFDLPEVCPTDKTDLVVYCITCVEVDGIPMVQVGQIVESMIAI